MATRQTFAAQFTASKAGKTGLTVTVAAKRVLRSTGGVSSLSGETLGSVTEMIGGVYTAQITSADTTLYDYLVVFTTTDSTVDLKDLPGWQTEWDMVTQTGGVVANVTAWGGAGVTGMPMPTYTQPTGFLALNFTTLSTLNAQAVANATKLAPNDTAAAASGSLAFCLPTSHAAGSVGGIPVLIFDGCIYAKLSPTQTHGGSFNLDTFIVDGVTITNLLNSIYQSAAGADDKAAFIADEGIPGIPSAVEAAIMDDSDSNAVLQAIVNKINAADPDLSGLTLSAIAQAARTEIDAHSTQLAAIKAKTDNLPASPGGGGGVGDGDVAVNHNTGGTDALRALRNGVGVDGCVIRAYLKEDYDAGDRTVRGEAITGTDGRWVQDMMLDAGVYVLTFSAVGFVIRPQEVTVGD